MEQFELGQIGKSTKFDVLSKEDLIAQNQMLESELARAVKELYRLKNQHLTDTQLTMVLQEHMSELSAAVFGASSERYKKPQNKPKESPPSEPRIKRPSQRYPNVPIRETPITIDPPPGCEACGKQMTASGMTEDSEQLTVIPKKYEIILTKRAIYRCSCQSCMRTAPLPPRIIEGSTYSDEMILDVVLSKYCDLIPMERYVKMAERGGLINLPPHSLIDLTHKFAFFVMEVYRLIGREILTSRVLAADETPHRMLEGSEKKMWYLWGFSTPKLCFLLARSTRSGDVAHEILAKSACEVLLSDVYTGYGKAMRLANEVRKSSGASLIVSANCNAHARRYFFKINRVVYRCKFFLVEIES